MAYDVDSGHGMPEEITMVPVQRPLRPLTAAEKLEATHIDVASRDSFSTISAQQDDPGETGRCAQLYAIEAAMNRKFGIESEAITRKMPEERSHLSARAYIDILFFWASGTMNITSFASGFLGWELGLGLTQSIVICVFASILGAAASAFCATMGPATGLRQMSISRYSMGWYPSKVVAVLNVITLLGWGALSCIIGGQALAAVAGGNGSIAAGIVIIATVSLVVSFLGLRIVILYERYAWLVFLVVFCIIIGKASRTADVSLPASRTAATVSGSILTQIGIVYSLSARWTTIASDYYVHYPANISRTAVFLLTCLGIAIPTSLCMVAGLLVGSGMDRRSDWYHIYRTKGLSYVVQAALYPRGLADFLLVLLMFSAVNMNILNTYSAAISIQQVAQPLARIPRFLWTLLTFVIVLVLALAGRDRILTDLQDLLGVLGYWYTSYVVIVIEEHVLFRDGSFDNYSLESWTDPKNLPMGLAAGAAFALGAVAWVVGMNQTWYVGPIAGLIGKDGGDIANELTFAVTLITFVPLRYLERKYVGR